MLCRLNVGHLHDCSPFVVRQPQKLSIGEGIQGTNSELHALNENLKTLIEPYSAMLKQKVHNPTSTASPMLSAGLGATLPTCVAQSRPECGQGGGLLGQSVLPRPGPLLLSTRPSTTQVVTAGGSVFGLNKLVSPAPAAFAPMRPTFVPGMGQRH